MVNANPQLAVFLQHHHDRAQACCPFDRLNEADPEQLVDFLFDVSYIVQVQSIPSLLHLNCILRQVYLVMIKL
jgi:hypothetical protein